MAGYDITKEMIANGLKELMLKNSFSSISINDISKQCKISRNTFYYHFKDKYEVISWIFYKEIEPIIGKPIEISSWSQGLVKLCRYMQDNKEFYLCALKIQGQNCFSECLMEFYQELINEMLLNAKTDKILSEKDIKVIARFYSHALIGIIMDWANEGMKTDPEHFVMVFEKIITGKMMEQVLSL